MSYIPSGDELKAQALARLAAKRPVIIRRSQRALLLHLLDGHQTVCADDIRAAVACPKGINPKCFGVVPTELAKLGIITKVGFKNTRRPKGHSRPVSEWGLLDAAAAQQWLAKKPEIALPPGDDDDHAEPAVTA